MKRLGFVVSKTEKDMLLKLKKKLDMVSLQAVMSFIRSQIERDIERFIDYVKENKLEKTRGGYLFQYYIREDTLRLYKELENKTNIDIKQLIRHAIIYTYKANKGE